jgi:DNA-binding transcriptional MerR regulator
LSERPAMPERPLPGFIGTPVAPVGVATIARDLADFLVEFSIVLHKRAMYPHGHPLLQEGAARFVARLEAVLERREGLIIGVARCQLIVGGVATEPRNALLSDLARRLHRQRIASLRFQRGVTLQEIDELLGSVSAEPDDAAGPLGLRPERAASWRHIQIQAPELGRLLLDQAAEPSIGEEPAGTAGELWVGLANLALSADGQGSPEGEDPLIVARAIDDQVGQIAYDRVVLDYLGQMAEEISGRAGAWEPRARERVSRLVANLHPDTLRSLLEAGADHAERRRFALTASEVLAVDAVVEVVEAAAVTTGQSISSHLLRLLHKFAHHAEGATGPARTEAESVLRKNVA